MTATGAPAIAAAIDPARKRAVGFILTTVALDAMGIGLLIPVLPALVAQLTGASLGKAAIYGGWLSATFATVQFLGGPILGSLSDHHGRRPVLLTSLAAFGLSYLLMAWAPGLIWLFVAQVFTGLFGATPATAAAYIADISRPEERTRMFGLVAAAFGTGLILGPAVGGLLADFGLRTPFLAAACLSLLNVAYGRFALAESLPREHRRPFSWRRANPLGAWLALRHIPAMGLLLFAVLFQRISTTTIPATWPYFSMQQYAWSTREVGYSLAAYGAVTVVAQVWLLRWVDRRAGATAAAGLGLLLLAIGFLGFAFGNGAWVAWLGVPLTAMGFAAGPALSGLLSARASAGEQGLLQGVIASIQGAAAISTPLVMPALFNAGSSGALLSRRFPGAPYVAASVLALAGLWCIWRGKRAIPHR